MAESGGNTRYIVSESGGHCRILICDNNWTVVPNATITGPTVPWCPKATAVTERGELLVADYNNNTINHYNLEGHFLGYIVKSQDGVHRPNGIAYRFPYLWVCNKNNIRCFKMKYE